MTDHLASKITSRNQSVPEIEELEGMLRTYRPHPGSSLQDKVAATTWMNPTNTLHQRKRSFSIPIFKQKRTSRWALAFLSILFVVLLLTLTNIGQSLADSISRFFKVSSVNNFFEVVPVYTGPTSSPNYPYDQFTLSIEQAEEQAGFKIKSLSALPNEDWVFHGASYEPETQGINLFYSLPDKESKTNHMEEIYLYVTEQKNDFENREWSETCPKDTIKEVKVNNWPAELEDGSVWQTETEPTPGVKRLWICKVMDPGVFMTLRWEETELKYQIDVNQLGLSGEGADMTIPWLDQQDLIDLAENLK
jgi:hypothetical protein